ncbi:hypothetical protein NL676_026535 [Syzygium grande]|nr:hypothetical protein NL676_026535 [Syzygium grande]
MRERKERVSGHHLYAVNPKACFRGAQTVKGQRKKLLLSLFLLPGQVASFAEISDVFCSLPRHPQPSFDAAGISDASEQRAQRRLPNRVAIFPASTTAWLFPTTDPASAPAIAPPSRPTPWSRVSLSSRS